ncbi:MAG: hypothetical protein ACRDPW_00225, partial [Mycobacteriales bacterium]
AAPHGWDVRVQAGSAVVECESAEELIDYMWPYFVPTLGSAHSVGQRSRALLLGGAHAASALDRMNRGHDAGNMERLEAEILAWDVSGEPGPYVDGEAQGGGTPYKYGPGLFSEHGITVERRENGRCALRFIGGGYGASGVELAQRFAAFSGRPVTYDRPPEITATLLPPPGATEQPLLPAVYWDEDTLGAYRLPVPVAELAALYSSITGTPMDEGRLAEILPGSYYRGSDHEDVDFARGSALVDVTSRVEGDGEKLRMALPNFQFSVQLADTDAHSAAVGVLLALQERQPPSRSPHGDLDHSAFTFNAATAEQIRDIAARQPPAVVGQRPLSAHGCESVQVFATDAMPQEIVVYYVGGRDPRDFVPAARAAVTSLAQGGSAEAVGGGTPQPNIIVVAHPDGPLSEADLRNHLDNVFRYRLHSWKAGGDRGSLPANMRLVVHAEADEPPLVAAVRRLGLRDAEGISAELIAGMVHAPSIEAAFGPDPSQQDPIPTQAPATRQGSTVRQAPRTGPGGTPPGALPAGRTNVLCGRWPGSAGIA